MIEYKLKSILDNCWILHNSGIRIAIINKIDNAYKVIGKIDKKTFNSIEDIANYLKVSIVIEEPEVDQQTTEIGDIDGYPIKHTKAFDIKNETFPSYAKVENSQTRFAAGYYGLLFPNGWAGAYCPKASTLNEIEWVGPFRTKLEMNNSITQMKRKSIKSDE